MAECFGKGPGSTKNCDTINVYRLYFVDIKNKMNVCNRKLNGVNNYF